MHCGKKPFVAATLTLFYRMTGKSVVNQWPLLGDLGRCSCKVLRFILTRKKMPRDTNKT